MNIQSQRKLTAAFKMGYFVSLIRKYLNTEMSYCDEKALARIKLHHKNIFGTMNELHNELFETDIQQEWLFFSMDEYCELLEKFYESTSEKIQRGGESFPEVSFHTGGFLSAADPSQIRLINIENYKSIISDLLKKIGLESDLIDLDKILYGLSSFDEKVSRKARNMLYLILSGNSSSRERVVSIQDLIEN